ncbi:MAG: nitroreductase family protein, partial [Gemmatimonadota bacterium]|nr:nitroreductase family protein [Gemmatimonadota bacterium]
MSVNETVGPAAPDTPFVPLRFTRLSLEDSLARARIFHEQMQRRRTTRHFARDPVPRELIEYAIRTAGTAP